MLVMDEVVAYITHERDLLVLETPARAATVGVQVPSARIEAGEDARRAVMRAAFDATGLHGLEVVRLLGTHPHATASQDAPRRGYFHLVVKALSGSTSNSERGGSRQDEGRTPRFRWLPLAPPPPLHDAQGCFLAELAASLGDASARTSQAARIRYAARVLVFDPSQRLLLLNGLALDGSTYWLAPGGGVKPGEDYASAAVREAREELGLSVELGPLVWYRRHVFETTRGMLDQTEQFFLARTQATDIAPIEPDHYVLGHRWWTLEEIVTSAEVFTPRKLAALLPALVNGELPATPIDVAP